MAVDPAAPEPEPAPAEPGLRDAFRLLLEEHLAFVHQYVASRRVRKEDREDLLQEVLCGAFRALGRLDPERGHPRKWLAGIAERQASNFRSRAYLRREVAHPDHLAEVQDEAPHPEEHAIRNEDRRILEDLLKRIPEERLAVLLPRDFLDMEFEEIAAKLQLSVETTRSRYYRARKDLEREGARWKAKERRRRGFIPLLLAPFLTDRARGTDGLDPQRPPGRGWGLSWRPWGIAVAVVLALPAALAWSRAPEPTRAVLALSHRAQIDRIDGGGDLVDNDLVEVVPCTDAMPSPAAPAAPAAAAPPAVPSPRHPPRSELLLMQLARAALVAGNYEEARKLLERHKRTFPLGLHATERDEHMRRLHTRYDESVSGQVDSNHK